MKSIAVSFIVLIFSTLISSAQVSLATSSGDFVFNTIEEALVEAQKNTESTLKLTDDVETKNTITVSAGDVTLDLNGKTWTISNTAAEGVVVKGGARLNIADASGTAKVVGPQNSSKDLVKVTDSQTSLTIEGVSIDGASCIATYEGGREGMEYS